MAQDGLLSQADAQTLHDARLVLDALADALRRGTSFYNGVLVARTEDAQHALMQVLVGAEAYLNDRNAKAALMARLAGDAKVKS